MTKASLAKLYIKFFKVGAMTFGGGYAMLPIIVRELKDEIGQQEIIDYYAVAGSLPGLIAINMAGLVGSKIRGIRGAIISALGVITPCIIIITIIAAFLGGFRDNIYVQKALSGVTICVLALITSSVIKLWKSAISDIPGFIIFLVALLISLVFSVSPIIAILGGALFGIIYKAAFDKANDSKTRKEDEI